VVDGLWVTQVRKDSKYGANDLQVYSWVCFSLGGFCGAVIYALMGYKNLYDAFFTIPAFFSLLQCVSSFFINKDFDGDA
jgi:hypothetical protein